MRLKVVGRAVPRLDATAKVTGRAQYTIDLAIPGMVAGRLLRSPYPHAQIQRIDTSAARAVPGVLAVLTSNDVQALERTGERFVDQPLLARGRVRYEGEPVAAVAAVDEVIADEALVRI
jgi:CO/xanthine dehydrogenase Mo-binding subunit